MGDIHDIPRDSASVDTVIATEVLSIVATPTSRSQTRIGFGPGASACCRRGSSIRSTLTRTTTSVFTSEGLAEIFRDFTTVQVTPLGNRLGSIWMLLPRRPRLLGWV